MKNKEKTNLPNIDTLIQKLKSKDLEFKKALKILQIFFFLLIIIYMLIFIFIPYSGININHRIGGGCYILAFTLFAFHFRSKLKRYTNINYSDSVFEVYKAAEKRYRFWQNNKLSSVIAIILLDVGTYFIAIKYFSDKLSLTQIFIGVQAFYFISVGIGFVFGFFKWKKEIRPVWISIKLLLKDFDE